MTFVAAARPIRIAPSPVIVALIAVACLVALLFRTEAEAAVAVWLDSTAYNHCFLVVPVIGVLLWLRRAELAQLVPTRGWVGVPFLFFAACLWWVGVRAGLMELRQLAAVGAVEAALVLLLGWRGFARFGFEFSYLVFAVPFGAFLHAPLQSWTASFIGVGLDVVGIPYWADGLAIDIAEGRFVVEEACSGLRFLIASVAFGALFAHLTFVSPWRKLFFLAASVAIPIVMNGFRALGIVLVGHWAGSAEAAAADHVIYGTVFFALVIAVMVLVGQACSDRKRGRMPAQPFPAASSVAGGPSLAMRGAMLGTIAAGLFLLHATPSHDLSVLAARLREHGAVPVEPGARNFPQAQWEVRLESSVRIAAASSFGDLRAGSDDSARAVTWFVDGVARPGAPGLRERLHAAFTARPLRVMILAAAQGTEPAAIDDAAGRVAQLFDLSRE